MNPTRCYWRRSTQAFEGCGCEVAPAAHCLCNHATDFSASSAPPKIKPISIEELTSVTLDDLLNAWMVFAVVGGMFGGTFFLAVGPGGYCLPRHPSHFETSSHELHGNL